MPFSPFSIIFVCTGNLCRSPLAETVARATLGSDGSITVSSAGTNALDGQQMPSQTVAAARRIGLSPIDATARRLTRAMVETTDLVITMTREQRRDVVRLAPSATRRTFTLRELDRALRFALAPAHEARLAQATHAGDARRRLVEFSTAVRGLASSPLDADDIDDPFGRSDRAFDRAASDIQSLVDSVLAAIRVYPSCAADRESLGVDASH